MGLYPICVFLDRCQDVIRGQLERAKQKQVQHIWNNTTYYWIVQIVQLLAIRTKQVGQTNHTNFHNFRNFLPYNKT